MRILLQAGNVWNGTDFTTEDILIQDGIVTARGAHLDAAADRVMDVSGKAVFPGFADVHVHLREPGFGYKETIATGSRACAAGGYTTVCAMPNLNPAPDSPEHIRQEWELIEQDACIRVLPYASITLGQKGEGTLVDFAALAPLACGFSDDGRYVKNTEDMRIAMQQVKAQGSIISAHCEDMTLIPKGGAIHAGSFAAAHDIPGIPSESEWGAIARDIALCRETGCDYHVCHISCKESAEIIRQAKAEGVNITCETGPHYLLLSQDDLQDEGRFKMNPPLRDEEDRKALVEALADGTIDCLATDHAPHSAEEKAKGLRGSAMGIVGIECAFPLLYTYLVEKGLVPLKTIIDCLTVRPRARFHLDGGMAVGDRAEITVFDLQADTTVNPDTFLSKGKATPFAGWPVHAKCLLTICGDSVAYEE